MCCHMMALTSCAASWAAALVSAGRSGRCEAEGNIISVGARSSRAALVGVERPRLARRRRVGRGVERPRGTRRRRRRARRAQRPRDRADDARAAGVEALGALKPEARVSTRDEYRLTIERPSSRRVHVRRRRERCHRRPGRSERCRHSSAANDGLAATRDHAGGCNAFKYRAAWRQQAADRVSRRRRQQDAARELQQ